MVNDAIDFMALDPFVISIDCKDWDLEILKQINPGKFKNVLAIVVEIPSNLTDGNEVTNKLNHNGFILLSTINNNNYVFGRK